MDQVQIKGMHTVDWNGKSENGELVSTGVYLLQFTSNDFSDKKKMVFLK
jgi:flagellar hook assembly protein FlgD